jgi:hypothetical protein
VEASEKPQLPLDTGAAEGAVRAIGDRLVIEALTVHDERAARVVRERTEAGHDPARAVADAIEIGSRVLESEGTAANVDYVKSELERNLGAVAERLGGILDGGQEELAEKLAATFDSERSGSVQQQVRELLNTAMEHQRAQLAKQFSAEDGANPLTDFKAAVVRAVKSASEAQQLEHGEDRKRIEALTGELTKLRERLGAQEEIEAERDRGTAKGLSFEERVDVAVESLAAARGDSASHTGGAHAEGGGKKGDTLVELGAADGPANGRIVFEAKDKKLSKNDAWKELNAAMAARAASFAVLVVAGEDRVPSGRTTLSEYEGNKMIVAVDREEPLGLSLEVAYRLAAARVAMARDRELRVDGAAVRDAAQEAITTLRNAQAIKATLTNIKTSSTTAYEKLEELCESVKLTLERIESLVSEAEPEAD